MAAQPPLTTRRCQVCGRLGQYEPDDRFCVACGSDDLADTCGCGRGFDYAVSEAGPLHCPRCGTTLRGRHPHFD
jgi:hypothetical protein